MLASSAGAPKEEASPDSAERLTLLGSTALQRASGGEPAAVLLASGKPVALLAYLHCAPAQSASRELLLELLWSDADPEKGRHTLRQTLWYVRRKLGLDPFATTGDGVRLQLPLPSDRAAFLAALDADDPDTAVQQYGGDFFPDFAAPGGAAFEHWADLERARLRGLFLGAATRVVHDRLSKGRARDGITIARRVHDLAPRHQASWRLLLESYLAANDPVGTALELERLERWLADEELDPDPSTVQVMKGARSGKNGASSANGTHADAPDEPKGLQAELVGRESEFAELLAAVDATKRGQARHIHVSAPAGHGKTRLLDGFAARLRSARVRVISVRATPAERSLPYAFAAQLVTALVSQRGASAVSPDTARTLIALAPASSSYLTAEPDRSTGDDALRRRSLALTELVTTIAHDAPLVMLVDDVHWMDSQSGTLLASLATRLGTSSALLVTAARSTDRFIDDVPSAKQVALAPLSVDDIGALVMSIGQLPSEPWSEALIQGLHSTSVGSPLLVLEALQLVMELAQLTLADQSWSTPDAHALMATLNSGRAMQQRLSALPPAARDALLRLSVAGIALDDVTLSQVLPQDGRDALTLLDARGLAVRTEESWRVAHDEIAAQTIEMASSADRVRANEAMATYLERVANEDVALLLRAALHRARAEDTLGLDRVFARAVRHARLSGEQAAIRSLGREVLGPAAATEEVDRLLNRLPWRTRNPARNWMGGALLVASVTVLASAFLYVRASRTALVGMIFTTSVNVGGRQTFVAMPDVTNDLATNAAIDLIDVDPPVPARVLDSIGIAGRLPDGTYVGSVMVTSDSTRGLDIVRVTHDGSVTTMLDGPHDQAAPATSPDGRRIVYLTGEWHPDQRAELALYDVGNGSSTRLTTSDDKETNAAWSHEGTRLAFTRSPAKAANSEVCWTSVDTLVGGCRSLADGLIASNVAGWRSDNELLVVAERVDSPRLMLILLNLASGEWNTIDEGGTDYRVDPAGRMVVCVCQPPGYSNAVVAVFSPATPAIKRVLRHDKLPLRRLGHGLVLWEPTGDALTSVTVSGPRSASLHQRVRFSVVGADERQRERSVPVTTWQSLDTGVVVAEADGYFMTRAAGVARITVSTGGMYSDTVTLVVRESRVTIAMRETWQQPLTARWIDFGLPVPTGVGSALHVNGDGTLTSGVVSRDVLNAKGGAGVRARFRLPLTGPQWQTLSIALSYFAPDEYLRAWPERRAGLLPTTWDALAAPRNCRFWAPRREGGEYMRLMALDAASRIVGIPRGAPVVSDGAWHEVTLQIFDDGRCALAIDAKAVAVSQDALMLDLPLHVVIAGNSVGTTVEVGALEAWTGVRSDIDWSALSTPLAAAKNATRAVPKVARPR